MYKGQTSVRAVIQDALCMFPKLYISQGANVGSHKSLEDIDVTNGDTSRAAYYASCDLKVARIIELSNTILWHSIKPVRLANGKVSHITIVTAHDNVINFKKGFEVKQGQQMGNMGNAGITTAGGGDTGIHAHVGQGYGHQIELDYTGHTFTLGGQTYKIYGLKNQIPFEDAYFMDDTIILRGKADWKYLKDVPAVDTSVDQEESQDVNDTIFIHDFVESWTVHKYGEVPTDNNIVNSIKPKKFGGLTYQVLEYPYKDTVTIQTQDYGKVNLPLGSVSKHWYAITKTATQKPQPKPQTKPTPRPKPKQKKITIQGFVESWSIHKLGQKPSDHNVVGYIKPKQFGGLTYGIVGEPYTNVVTIQTRDYGKVNLPLAGIASHWYKIA